MTRKQGSSPTSPRAISAVLSVLFSMTKIISASFWVDFEEAFQVANARFDSFGFVIAGNNQREMRFLRIHSSAILWKLNGFNV